jgi:hypothetical protein
MYTITFDRVGQQPPSQAKMAMMIFTWVYLGKRILNVYELQYALAVQAGDTALIEDGIPPEETLLECCLGLVVIERETSTIRFAHFTLQEYLDKHWQDLFASGHTSIASTCLTYLHFEHPHLSYKELREAPTLLRYVVDCLGHHLREGTNEEVNRQTLKLLTIEAKFELLTLGILNTYGGAGPSPLHWAVYFGVSSLAAMLLQTNNYPINIRDDTGRTPLFCYDSYVGYGGWEDVRTRRDVAGWGRVAEGASSAR